MSEACLDKPKPRSPIDAIKDEERMQIEEIPLFMDLMTLALQTDSTRVATFEIPLGFHINDLDVGGYHGLSHHSKQEGLLTQLQIVEKYLMSQFAHLLGKLKEAGLMDSTLVVIGSGMGNASNHSNRDLPVLLAGGGIKHQGHLVCPREEHKRVELSNLWLSVLQWFGVERERFGRSTGHFRQWRSGDEEARTLSITNKFRSPQPETAFQILAQCLHDLGLRMVGELFVRIRRSTRQVLT